MDIDVEWERLLPLCLPDDVSNWLDDFNKKNDGVCLLVGVEGGDGGSLRRDQRSGSLC